MALVRRLSLIAGAGPRGGECHGRARLFAQMGDASRGGAESLRHPACRAGGPGAHFGALREWQQVRPAVHSIDRLLSEPASLAALASSISEAAQELAGDRAWRGPAGRLAAETLAELQASDAAQRLIVSADD